MLLQLKDPYDGQKETVVIDHKELRKQDAELYAKSAKEYEGRIAELGVLLENALKFSEEQKLRYEQLMEEQRLIFEKHIEELQKSILPSVARTQELFESLWQTEQAKRKPIPKPILALKYENALIEKVCPLDGVTPLFDENGNLDAEADHINGNRSDNRSDNVWYISTKNHKKKTAGKYSPEYITSQSIAYLAREKSRDRQNILPFVKDDD